MAFTVSGSLANYRPRARTPSLVAIGQAQQAQAMQGMGASAQQEQQRELHNNQQGLANKMGAGRVLSTVGSAVGSAWGPTGSVIGGTLGGVVGGLF